MSHGNCFQNAEWRRGWQHPFQTQVASGKQLFELSDGPFLSAVHDQHPQIHEFGRIERVRALNDGFHNQ